MSRSEYAVHHAMIALLLINGAAPSIATASKPKIQTDFANLVRARYAALNRVSFLRTGNLRQSVVALSALRNRADYEVPGVNRQDALQALQFSRQVADLVRQAMA